MALVIPFPISLVGHKKSICILGIWQHCKLLCQSPVEAGLGASEQALSAQLSTKDDHQTIYTWQLLRKLRGHSMEDFENLPE